MGRAYISQSTESSRATFSDGMLTTLHNMVTITIAALGMAAEDMLANVHENLYKNMHNDGKRLGRRGLVRV